MVSRDSVVDQLRKIGVNQNAWGRQEIQELPNIIFPEEQIFECVNGLYEGGFALLVATDVRVLLIDKKPLKYLTVEDLRFDMINEIDYSHRALGAYVKITTGNRELNFRSYNQTRLRKLINHVQNRMAEIKKKLDTHAEGQAQHLEQINGHLRTYLMAQYKHQEKLLKNLEDAQRHGTRVDRPPAPRPSPELSDYLLAHGLMDKHETETGEKVDLYAGGDKEAEALYKAGYDEIFNRRSDEPSLPSPVPFTPDPPASTGHPFDVNPLRLAYSKLPMAMRNRKFGRPSLHAHSAAVMPEAAETAA